MKTVNFLDGTILYIEDQVLVKMFRHIQCCKQHKESGGILLGKKIQNHPTYVLTEISEPTKRDERKRFSFLRDKNSAQHIINQRWNETNGIVNYLGEWHTHPEYSPIPSQTDKKLICQVINDNSNVFTKVFLIIVGMDQSLYIGLADSNVSDKIILSEHIGGIE